MWWDLLKFVAGSLNRHLFPYEQSLGVEVRWMIALADMFFYELESSLLSTLLCSCPKKCHYLPVIITVHVLKNLADVNLRKSQWSVLQNRFEGDPAFSE